MTETKRRAITLLRVSTDQQDVSRQRVDIAMIQRTHNLEIVRTVELEDVSGTKTRSNKHVQRILADLANADVDGIVVSHIDRLVRPGKLGDLAIFDPFQEHKKKIWTATNGEIDLSTDGGFLQALFGGGQAALELRELRRRMLGGKELNRKKGLHVDGPATLCRGVSFDPKTGKWSHKEPDISRIKRAIELVLQGYGYGSIAREVGGGFTSKGIRYTLRNPIWKGIRVYRPNAYRPKEFEAQLELEPIVSDEVWQQVQDLMDERSNGIRAKRIGKPSRFLASGLLRCACGRPWYVRATSRPGRGGDMYYCSSKHPSGPGCGTKSIWREHVDDAVERALQKYLGDCEVIAGILGAFRQASERQDNSAELKQELDRLAAQQKRLVDGWQEGLITKSDFAERSRNVERQIREVRAMLPAAAPQFDLKLLALALVHTFRTRFPALPFAEKRALLRRAVGEIRLDGAALLKMTLTGAFVGEMTGAKVGSGTPAASPFSALNNSHQFSDLEIIFPEPFPLRLQ